MVDGESDAPVEWPHVFARERTTGPGRLAIASRGDPVKLLCDLAEFIGPHYFLLYVLVASRGAAECGEIRTIREIRTISGLFRER
jgi:hypothetical protein